MILSKQDLTQAAVSHLVCVVHSIRSSFNSHLSPARIEALEDQITPHLSQLELGQQISPEELLRKCHCRQVEAMRFLEDATIPAIALPSLTCFEASVRATQPGRSTGLDPLPSCLHHDQAPVIAKFYYALLLKMHLWCVEPLQFKGGVMTLIPKKGDLSKAMNYRGILLLASIAKRAHSLMRGNLMKVFSPQRAEGQLGGFTNQMVQFGFHSVMTWTHILEQHGVSTAVFYLDLASAFHHLVRELVLGVACEKDFETIITTLQHAGHPIEAGHEGHELVSVLERLGCDQRLLRLLRDVHTDTWFTVTQQEVIRTTRGTRPGSPLADAVFHVVMAHIMTSVRNWLFQIAEFQELLQQWGLPTLTVVWADDVAIPLASASAVGLLPLVRALVRFVDEQFAKHGFTVNYDLNKTNVVVSFQGPDAPALRREFLLIDRPGMDCEVGSNKPVWLHFKNTYKHLGFTYAASQTLEVEIRQRIGQAKSAMTMLGRPILTNRHLPVHVRLRLFRVFVETRMFYGLGTWRTPPLKLLHLLRSTYVSLLKRVLRVGHQEHHSNSRIFQLADTMDIRHLLAIDRLRYARKLFRDGPDFLQRLVHLEHTHTMDSWMHGLQEDIRWLEKLAPNRFPSPQGQDLTALIDFWQNPKSPWKRTLRFALMTAKAQEYMMTDLQQLHSRFFEILRGGGAEFNPEVDILSPPSRGEIHSCACGRQFDTPQGLALHRVKAHQIYAPEHHMTSGATCAHCLRFFWTSARLQQHLSYMPRGGGVNRCFQALREAGHQGDYQVQRLTPALKGTIRFDALQTAGPQQLLRPWREEQIQTLRLEIEELEAELAIPARPDNHLQAGQDLADRLTTCTRIWIDKYRGRSRAEVPTADFGDWWMRLLFTFDAQFEAWTELVFLSWGQHILPELLAQTLDGEVEFAIEEAYYELYKVLPRIEGLDRIAFKRQQIQQLEQEAVTPAQPHRPRRLGTANPGERQRTIQVVPSAFETQEEWLRGLRLVKWATLPVDRHTPIYQMLQGRPHFLLVHIFSGRRRWGDVHCCIDEWAKRRNVTVTILSMDTAVSVTYGNLAVQAASWTKLVDCYERGWVSATLAGTPCETFSEARFQELPPGDEGPRKAPRPLRSFERLLGLMGLSLRELAQLNVGTQFFMQGLLLLAYQTVQGGSFISEHPATPKDASRPSIWTSPWLQLMQNHPEVQLHTIPQWPFGSSVPKPTGLLALRLPRFLASIFKHADPDARRPTAVAIGRDAAGGFCTSKHKEYPPRFCAALAQAITDQLDSCMVLGHLRQVPCTDECTALHRWLVEAKEACQPIRETSVWLPDYQRLNG